MNHGLKHIIVAILITSIAFTFWFSSQYPKAFEYIDMAYRNVGQGVAAVLLHSPVTSTDMQTKYDAPVKKVRVLVVPGHEPGYGGAEYGSLKEREMNVELAKDLGELLKNNGHYDVMLTRDDASWSPVFSDYFEKNWDEIITFLRDNKRESLNLVAIGKTTAPVSAVYHNTARPDVALRLFGINKWENENAIDIAIHIHFNDNPRYNTDAPGEYSGFAIYVPEHQYDNSSITKTIADAVAKRLSKYNAVSDFPAEHVGVVEEPDLIAIGAYNTTNSASMLIEYGYIYEPQFANPEVRSPTIRDLAFQTYLGLQDFFGSGNDVSYSYDTLMLPHEWRSDMTRSNASLDDVLALQSVLTLEGLYPGPGSTKNDCPRTGKIGPCTLGAIAAFQKKYGITGEYGIVGPKTRAALNEKYAVKAF